MAYVELEALDISNIHSSGVEDALANQVVGFINKNGFCHVTGDGLTGSQILRQYALASAMFDLPLDEKLKYTCDTASGDFRGYKPRSTGALAARDTDERYNIAKFTPEHAHLSHPQIVRRRLAEIEAFSRHVHDAMLLPLLRVFAVALELPDKKPLCLSTCLRCARAGVLAVHEVPRADARSRRRSLQHLGARAHGLQHADLCSSSASRWQVCKC